MFELYPPASENDISQLQDFLKSTFDDGIENLDKFPDLEKFPKFSEFLNSHTQRRTYYFQVRKCANADCEFHKPLRGTEEVTTFLDPEPYTDEENILHYREGIDAEEKYLPSKLEDPSKRPHNIPFTVTAHTADNVGIAVRCAYCKKTRLIYSQRKLSLDEQNKLKRLLSNVEYFCGASLSEYGDVYDNKEGNRDVAVLDKVFAKENLPCSSNFIRKTICIFCGKGGKNLIMADDHGLLKYLSVTYLVYCTGNMCRQDVDRI